MNTYYIAGYPVSDELYHQGIKGQRWGIRRYQNLDGTLTPAGKARYGKDISSISDSKLNRQMQRNQFANSYRINEHFRNEDKLNSNFVYELKNREKEQKVGVPNMSKEGERFIRDLASVRLKSMGYEANERNVEVLAGKKWFRNSSWISNTLASVGVKDVDYTSRDDIIYKKKNSSVLDDYKK